MQDPRFKHEYLDSGQIWVTITGDGDESDKQVMYTVHTNSQWKKTFR